MRGDRSIMRGEHRLFLWLNPKEQDPSLVGMRFCCHAVNLHLGLQLESAAFRASLSKQACFDLAAKIIWAGQRGSSWILDHASNPNRWVRSNDEQTWHLEAKHGAWCNSLISYSEHLHSTNQLLYVKVMWSNNWGTEVPPPLCVL